MNNAALVIKVGSISAIDADDRHPNGYNMFEFTSSPYDLEENKTIDVQVIYSGELVSNVMYFSPAISHSTWYVTPR